MNRHERRAEQRGLQHVIKMIKAGRAINTSVGYLGVADPNYGTPVICAVCDAPHSASGIAQVEDKEGISHSPLCQACLASPDISDAIARKYWDAPDLILDDGGDLADVLVAMDEKRKRSEH